MSTVKSLLRSYFCLLSYFVLLATPAIAQQAAQLANDVVPKPINTDTPALAADASKSTASVMHPGINGNGASERVVFASTVPAGTTAAGVCIRFDNVALNLLQAGVLPNISITTYTDGVATGEKWTSSQLLTLSLLQSGQPADVKLSPAPTKAFNQLELRADGAVNAYTLSFFAAFGPAPAPLPVQLVSFTATNQGSAAVRLAWATASELNSAYFEVERSTDGTTFRSLGQVAAAGTSASGRSYSYVDASPQSNLLYYRLCQVDRDGTASYTPIRTVSLAPAGSQLALYPVPARAQATLIGTLPGTDVQLVNAQGQYILRSTADATGMAQLVLPASLAPGVYVVRAGLQSLRLTVAD